MKKSNGSTTIDFSCELNRLSEAFYKVGEGLSMAADAMVRIFSKIGTSFSPPVDSLLQSIKSDEINEIDRAKALKLGLVGHRVVQLSYRRGRTGHKNMNRIRKELYLYAKRKGPFNCSIRVSQSKYFVREVSKENG
nr:MAG TPA: hypothetical protein [Caudoviricetes sp.]